MVRVYTNLAYAKFVEFGTGVTAKNSSHPSSSEFGWSYDTNDKGEKGWVYRASDGNFYWTQGEEAHQFMYKAFQDLKANYMRIAKQVLVERGIIKGMQILEIKSIEMLKNILLKMIYMILE